MATHVYKYDIVDIDLNSGTIFRSFVNRAIGTGDNQGDRFGVFVYRDGEPEDLTDATCIGFFRDPMGNNIEINGHIGASNRGAYVILPQACYNYEGAFTLTIKLIANGVTSTVRIVDGTVANTHWDGAVAPTEAVPTYQEVLAVYDQMEAAVEDVSEFREELEVMSGTVDGLSGTVDGLNDRVDGDRIAVAQTYTKTTGYINSETGEVVESGTTKATSQIELTGYRYIEYPRIRSTSDWTPAGMAFYDSNGTYVSGQRCLLNNETASYEQTVIEIPANAKYARFTVNEGISDSFPLYFAPGYEFTIAGQTEITGYSVHGKKVPFNRSYTTAAGYINASTGERVEGGTTLATGNINIDGFRFIEYPRIHSTSNWTPAGMAFYDSTYTYISGQRCVINSPTSYYEPTMIEVPANARFVRFTINPNISADFPLYNIEGYENSLEHRVSALENSGGSRVVSILGDSISTFALEAGTGSGNKYAPAGCTTNYPGNRVRYPYNDVLTVDQMWWKIVLDYFGWTLGINESWAGSRIAWEGDESETTGANIYIGSPTRVGHLDENSTPDMIFIFGGTNDINHLATSKIGSLPTDDPTNYTTQQLNALAVDEFKKATVAMILRIQHEYPEAQILALIPYFVNQNYSSTPYTVKLFNDALIECYDYLGVDYIDLRKIVNVYDITTLLGDSLHPNAQGMRLIADAVIRKIRNL